MNIEKFDTRYFCYNIIIGDDQGNKMLLTANSIENLTIVDNIFFPFPIGTITIVNSKDVLQSGLNKKNSINFAGNNRDTLMIDIMPNVTGDIQQDINNDKLRKIFGLGMICTINEIQDSDQSANSSNMMNFRSVYHQMALENSSFISSDIIAAKDQKVELRDLNNSERSVRTGELLKEIIKSTYNVDNEDSIIDKDNFDLGATKVKWYSRGNANAFQNMMYINSLHQSEDSRDPCILFFDASIAKFKHIALSKLFDLQRSDPSKYNLETFIVGSGQSSVEGSGSIGQGMKDVSNIIEHKLSPINGDNFTRNITNNVFYSTAGADRNTVFSCKPGSIQQVFTDYKKLYVDSLKNVDNNIIPSVDLDSIQNFNNLRPRIQSYNAPISYDTIIRNNLMKNLLINSGDNIVFRALGSTHRKSGHFIDIATTSDIADTGAVKSLIGRWFIVSVKHIFAGNNYYNIIEAVKTYTTP